jgi:hypothetical protein
MIDANFGAQLLVTPPKKNNLGDADGPFYSNAPVTVKQCINTVIEYMDIFDNIFINNNSPITCFNASGIKSKDIKYVANPEEFINRDQGLDYALMRVSNYIKQLVVFFRAARQTSKYITTPAYNDMMNIRALDDVNRPADGALAVAFAAYNDAITKEMVENANLKRMIDIRKAILGTTEELEDAADSKNVIFNFVNNCIEEFLSDANTSVLTVNGIRFVDTYNNLNQAFIDYGHILTANYALTMINTAPAPGDPSGSKNLNAKWKDCIDYTDTLYRSFNTLCQITQANGPVYNHINTVFVRVNKGDPIDNITVSKGVSSIGEEIKKMLVAKKALIDATAANEFIKIAYDEAVKLVPEVTKTRNEYLDIKEYFTKNALNQIIFNKFINPISAYCKAYSDYIDMMTKIDLNGTYLDRIACAASNDDNIAKFKRFANKIKPVADRINEFMADLDNVDNIPKRLQMSPIPFKLDNDRNPKDGESLSNGNRFSYNSIYQIDGEVLNHPYSLYYVRNIIIANADAEKITDKDISIVKDYANIYNNSATIFKRMFETINVNKNGMDNLILKHLKAKFAGSLDLRKAVNNIVSKLNMLIKVDIIKDNKLYASNYTLNGVSTDKFTVNPEWFDEFYDVIMGAAGGRKVRGGAPAIPTEIIKIIGLMPSVNQNTYTLLNDIWCSLFGAIIATHEFNAKQNSTAKSVLSTKKKQFLVIHGGARTLDENGNEVYSSQINVNPDLVELYYNMLSLTMYYINNLTAPSRTNKSITITNFRIEENFSEFITLMQSSTYVEKRNISDLGVSDLEVFVNLVNNVYAKYTNSNEELESIFKRIIIDYRDSVSKHIVIMTDEEVSLLESSRGYDAPDVINVNQLYGGEYDLVRKPLAPSNKFLAPTQLEYEIKNKYSIHMYKDLLLKFINQIVESADETSNKISLRSSFQECAQKISNTRYEEKLTVLSDFLTKGIISTSDTLQTQMFVHEFITWPCKVLQDLGNYLSKFIIITDKTPQYDALFVYGTEELVSFARSENLNTFNFNKAEQLFKSMYETINKVYIESTAYLSKSARENCDREIRKVEKLYTTLFTSHQDYVKSTTELSLNHIARRIVNNPLAQNAMNVNINSNPPDPNNDLNKTKKDGPDGKVSWIPANEDVIMSKNNIVGHFNIVVVQYLLDLYNVGESKIISEFVNNFYSAISANKNFLRTDEDVLQKPSSYVTNTVYNMLNYIKNCKIAGKPDIITDDITSSISITSKSNLPPIMAYYRYVFTCISRAADNLDQLYNEQNTQVFYAIKNYCGILIGGINTVSELILEGSTKKVFNTDDTYMSNAIFTPFTITNLLGRENLTIQGARQYYSLCRFMFYGGNSSVEPKWFRLDKSEFKFNNSLLKPEIDSIIDSNYYNNLVLLSRHNYYVINKYNPQPYDVNTAISYTRNSIMENAIKKYLKNANEISGSAMPITAFDKDSNKITCVVCPLNPKYLMQYVPFYNIITYSYLYEQLVDSIKGTKTGNVEELKVLLNYNHEGGLSKDDYNRTVDTFKADTLLKGGLGAHNTYVKTIISRIKDEANKENQLFNKPAKYFKFPTASHSETYGIANEFDEFFIPARLHANGEAGGAVDTFHEHKCNTPFGYIVGHADVDNKLINTISNNVIDYVKNIKFESNECFALLGRPYLVINNNGTFKDTQLSRAIVQFYALLLVENVSSDNGDHNRCNNLVADLVVQFTDDAVKGDTDALASQYINLCKIVDVDEAKYLNATNITFTTLKNMNKRILFNNIDIAAGKIIKLTDANDIKTRKANIIRRALEQQFKTIIDHIVEILKEPGANYAAINSGGRTINPVEVEARKNIEQELTLNTAVPDRLPGLMNIVDAKRIIYGLPIELINTLEDYNIEFVRTVLMMNGYARKAQRDKYIELCKNIPQLVTSFNINNALPSTYIGTKLVNSIDSNSLQLYKYIYSESELTTYLRNIPVLFGCLEYGTHNITNEEFQALSNQKFDEYLSNIRSNTFNTTDGNDMVKNGVADAVVQIIKDKFSRVEYKNLEYTKYLARAMRNNTDFTVYGVLNGGALKAAEEAITLINNNTATLIRDLAMHIDEKIKPINPGTAIDDPGMVVYARHNTNVIPDLTIVNDFVIDHTSDVQRLLAKRLMASPKLMELYEYCKTNNLIIASVDENKVLDGASMSARFATIKNNFRQKVVDASHGDTAAMATTILLRVVNIVCKHIETVKKRIEDTYKKIMENADKLELNTYSCFALSVINNAPQIRTDVFAFRFKSDGAADAIHTLGAAVLRTTNGYNFADVDAANGIEAKKKILESAPYDVRPDHGDANKFYMNDVNVSAYYTLARVIIEYLNKKEIIDLYTPSMSISSIKGINPKALLAANVSGVYNSVFNPIEEKLNNGNNKLDIVIHIVKIAVVHQILESLSVEKLVTNNIIAKRNEMLIISPVTFNE